MYDPCDVPQDWVGKVVVTEERLEAAVAFVVGEDDAPDVERRRIGRNLVRIVHEDELCLCVDKATDQPRARRTVDVAVAARRPPHATTSSSVSARRAIAASARSRSGGGK